jgi:hypothetical protein
MGRRPHYLHTATIAGARRMLRNRHKTQVYVHILTDCTEDT